MSLFPVNPDIPEIDQQVYTYKDEVQNIYCQDEGTVSGEKFRSNTGKISRHDEQNEKRTHPLVKRISRVFLF